MAALAVSAEYGPERSIIFALYPLVWGVAFLVAGLVTAWHRPNATTGDVLVRAAVWATVLMVATVVLLIIASMFFHP